MQSCFASCADTTADACLVVDRGACPAKAHQKGEDYPAQDLHIID